MIKIKASDQKIRFNIPEMIHPTGKAGTSLSKYFEADGNIFYVRVIGNIQAKFNVKRNDLLVVNRQLEPGNNSLVISVKEGEFQLDKVSKAGNKFFLMPESSLVRPIEIADTMDLRIWGVVTHIITTPA